MAINILIFGQLTDITGSDHLRLTGITDTNGLVELLKGKYPAIANIKYRIAVDKKMISENVAITEESTIALMPPFSGG